MPGRRFAPEASIVLISLRGTGRTTLGLLAAASLGFRLIETDTIFQEAFGLSRRAYISKHGHIDCRSKEFKLLEGVLAQNPSQAVIICGPICVDESGQTLLRRFAKDHPVIYILRDPESISHHLKCSSEAVSAIIEAGNPTFRSISSFEFFNLASPQPGQRQDGREHSLAVQRPTLALKEVQKDFLHLAYSIQGHAAARTAQARTPTAFASLERKLYTYALQLPLEQVPQMAPVLRQEDCLVDAVELRVDLSTFFGKSLAFDHAAASYITKSFWTIRNASRLPLIFHITHPSGFPQVSCGISYENAVELYRQATHFALRFLPEYLTVDLGLGNALVEDIVSAKGHTKIIGDYFDNKIDNSGWRSQHRMSFVVRAQDLGCDLVRISQPALSEADNLEAQRFLKTVTESRGRRIPVIAYNTGHIGRQSRVLNPILSPVVSTLRIRSSTQQMSDEGLFTVQEAQKILYSSFTLEPKRFGIFGQGVFSSLSPVMQGAAFQYSSMPHTYQAFDSSSLQDLALFIKSPTFGGASITSPFKQEIIPLIDILSPDAQAIGAVNTVIPLRSVGDNALLDRTSTGPVLALYGENTDWIGVHTTVRRNLSPVNAVKHRTSALVLGAGGMAHASVYSLIRLGVQNIWIWSRTLANSKALAARYNGKRYSIPRPELVAMDAPEERQEDDYFGPANVRVVENLEEDWQALTALPTIIVSCIPSPQIEIPSSWLGSKTGGVVVELAYDRLETTLLKQVRELGRPEWIRVHGLHVLPEQGISQFELFTGRKAPEKLMRADMLREFKRMHLRRGQTS
ncbi:hypothetical protein KVR01_002650 [Diaporthe batatas]|uniref:uncharacterized protein n=1 Tax=Diaporthe batatas TaxID=748121 RepID=UPI001D04401B|nr:uncharacterized protein KVR01_002650 [Diaporthe batatas]KAG8166961.1 hypothetical protein KVR01_002650 [Diaporthe batatas]